MRAVVTAQRASLGEWGNLECKIHAVGQYELGLAIVVTTDVQAAGIGSAGIRYRVEVRISYREREVVDAERNPVVDVAVGREVEPRHEIAVVRTEVQADTESVVELERVVERQVVGLSETKVRTVYEKRALVVGLAGFSSSKNISRRAETTDASPFRRSVSSYGRGKHGGKQNR